MDLLSHAKTKAIEVRDTFAFVSAENAYAFGLVKKESGRSDRRVRDVRKDDIRELALRQD